MKNFFENMFGGNTPQEEPKEEKTDGAGYMAVPERGTDHGDVNMEGENIENEIKRIESVLALYKETGNDSGLDIAFLTDKLEHLKASQEK